MKATRKVYGDALAWDDANLQRVYRSPAGYFHRGFSGSFGEPWLFALLSSRGGSFQIVSDNSFRYANILNYDSY